MRYWFYNLEIGYIETLDKLNKNWYVNNLCTIASFWPILLFSFNKSQQRDHLYHIELYLVLVFSNFFSKWDNIYIEFTMRHLIYSRFDWVSRDARQVINQYYANNLCIITSSWPVFLFYFHQILANKYMPGVNNKDTRTTLLTLFQCLNCWLWICFIPFLYSLFC